MPKPRVILLPAANKPKNALKLTRSHVKALMKKEPDFKKLIDEAIRKGLDEEEFFHYSPDFVKWVKGVVSPEKYQRFKRVAKKMGLIAKPRSGDFVFYFDPKSLNYFIDPKKYRLK